MPSVSKKQQKFMGIVRSIQKGEEPASKFSKDAQDAAKKMKKSSVKKYAKTKHGDLPVKKESWMNKLGGSYFEEGLQRDRNNLAMYIIDLNNMLSQAKLSKNPKAKKYIKFIQQDIKDAKKKLSKLKEERDYKDEYKKFQSSTKAKKYRAELNKYNRQKGTYGNGDGKDASHKNGKIVGFEKESKNRGRAEKSRLKKEFLSSINPIIDEAIDGLVLEGVDDPGIFKAIFLAGGPGSGKTFVAQKLFGIPETLTTSAKGLKLVNQDTEFEYLLKKYFGTIEIDKFPPDVFADLVKPTDQGGSNVRPFAKELNREKLRLYTKGKLGVIIDGTAHKVDKIKERKKELEDLGYDTYMVFVNTTLEAALERNEARKRTVPVKIATDSWNDVQKNMADLKSMFKSNFYMADNSKHLDPEQAEKKFNALVKKGIDKFMKKPIRNKIAKDWVKKQRILKKQGIKESVMVNELSLKKLEDAIKDFKKKIKKQGRVTNARDEDHLERLMKVYNDMGGRKIKENNELFEWLQEACWKGYEKKGMKKMFGKMYPNCVKKTKKKEGVNESRANVLKAIKIAKSMGGNMSGAVKRIEKIQKGLSKQIEVEDALRTANESVDEVKPIRLKGKSGMGKISHLGVPQPSKGVEKLLKIADSGYGKVGGTTVDGMSANLFKQVYNKANDDIKQKLNTKNEKQLVRILGGMWKKFGKNITIGSSL